MLSGGKLAQVFSTTSETLQDAFLCRGVIHIVGTHKGGPEGSSQMSTRGGEEVSRLRTYAKKKLLDYKISNLFFFYTKEALLFLQRFIVYRKV